MKTTLMAILLFAFGACTYGELTYGYYWNPITILSLADEALEENDENAWSEVLSEKALCVYGTKAGMANVRSTLKKVDQNSMQAPVRVSATYLKKPAYLGYFSYYQEVYVSKATDVAGNLMLKATILCNFGRTENSMSYVNAPLSKYSTRSCSIIEIKNFDKPLKVATYCED